MQSSLTQKCGPATRTFTLQPNGIEIDARGRGTHSSKHFSFSQFGPQKTDYDITQKRIMRFTPRQSTALTVVTFGISIVFFGFSAQVTAPDRNPSVAGVITVVLGWLFAAAAVAVLVLRSKSVRCKRVYFEGGSLEFFYRNQQDDDQIESFLAAYRKVETTYERKLFLKALAEHPKDMENWLEALAVRGIFSDEEYAKHLKTINAAGRKAAKRTKAS